MAGAWQLIPPEHRHRWRAAALVGEGAITVGEGKKGTPLPQPSRPGKDQAGRLYEASLPGRYGRGLTRMSLASS